MNVKTIKDNDLAILTVETEKLDSLVAPDLKAEFVFLEKTGTKNVIVDLLNAKYCDSSGLSALLVGNRLFKENGKVVVANLQPAVLKLIEISQLHKVLHIANSVDDARTKL